MLAIYKKELKLYFSSVTGYLVTAFIIFLTGIFTSVINFATYSPSFEIVINSVCVFLLFVVPLLTMKVFSEERKQKTDQLLYSLPISMKDVVFGKYFALMTLLLVPTVALCAFPLILSQYGPVSFKTAYSAILGFYFLCGALSAMGMFMSSLTENQLIAAVLSFGVLIISYLIPSFSSYISASAVMSFRAFTFIILVLMFVIFFMTKNVVVSIAFMLILEVPLFLIYRNNLALISGKFNLVVDWFAVFSKLTPFVNGIFDISSLVYYATVAGLFICFTVQSMEKRRWS